MASVAVDHTVGNAAPAERRDLDRPRRPGSFGLQDAGVVAGCALSSFSLVWLAFQLSPFTSPAEFAVC